MKSLSNLVEHVLLQHGHLRKSWDYRCNNMKLKESVERGFHTEGKPLPFMFQGSGSI